MWMALNHWPLNSEKEIYWNWEWGLYHWILSWNAIHEIACKTQSMKILNTVFVLKALIVVQTEKNKFCDFILAGRLDIEKFSCTFFETKQPCCIFRLKIFKDEIHILICKIYCCQVFGMEKRWNRHFGQWNW